MGTLEGFMFGLLGGVLAELAGLYKLRHASKPPQFLKSWFYGIVTLAMICAGGSIVFVYLQSGVTFTPIVAVHVGASAPLMLRNLAAIPPPGPGSSDKQDEE